MGRKERMRRGEVMIKRGMAGGDVKGKGSEKGRRGVDYKDKRKDGKDETKRREMKSGGEWEERRE